MKFESRVAENYSVTAGEEKIYYGEGGVETHRERVSVGTMPTLVEEQVIAHWEHGSMLVKTAEGNYRCRRGPELSDAEYIRQLEWHVISKHCALILAADQKRNPDPPSGAVGLIQLQEPPR